MVVIWNKTALMQLQKAYEYIFERSFQSAQKFRVEIFDIAENLKNNPLVYPLDKYRNNNDGSMRAFEFQSYRVAYQVTSTEIRILRVRHTSREPKSF